MMELFISYRLMATYINEFEKFIARKMGCLVSTNVMVIRMERVRFAPYDEDLPESVAYGKL